MKIISKVLRTILKIVGSLLESGFKNGTKSKISEIRRTATIDDIVAPLSEEWDVMK